MNLDNISLEDAAQQLEKFAASKQADLQSMGYGGLVGAGLGAGAGLLAESFRKKRKKNYLNSMLSGGVAGGALGAGVGGLYGLGKGNLENSQPGAAGSGAAPAAAQAPPAKADARFNKLKSQAEQAYRSGDANLFDHYKNQIKAEGTGEVKTEFDLGDALTNTDPQNVAAGLTGAAGLTAASWVPPSANRMMQNRSDRNPSLQQVLDYGVQREDGSKVKHNEFATRLGNQAAEAAKGIKPVGKLPIDPEYPQKMVSGVPFDGPLQVLEDAKANNTNPKPLDLQLAKEQLSTRARMMQEAAAANQAKATANQQLDTDAKSTREDLVSGAETRGKKFEDARVARQGLLRKPSIVGADGKPLSFSIGTQGPSHDQNMKNMRADTAAHLGKQRAAARAEAAASKSPLKSLLAAIAKAGIGYGTGVTANEAWKYTRMRPSAEDTK